MRPYFSKVISWIPSSLFFRHCQCCCYSGPLHGCFCLLGTFFPLIFTRLAASHHSRLCLNATSHGLSQHASTLSLVFYFLQRLSLSDCFLHLPIFCIPLLTCKLLENTLLSRLPLSVVFSVVIQTVGSGIRFARFGCCHWHPLLRDFTPVASFCVAQFSHVKTETMLASAQTVLWGIKDTIHVKYLWQSWHSIFLFT